MGEVDNSAKLRDEKGRFLPGQHLANPGAGRPSLTPIERMSRGSLERWAREHARQQLEVLHNVAQDAEQPAAARITAADKILDRGYGKPNQPTSDETAPEKRADLTKLSIEQLRALREILLAAQTGEADKRGSE